MGLSINYTKEPKIRMSVCLYEPRSKARRAKCTKRTVPKLSEEDAADANKTALKLHISQAVVTGERRKGHTRALLAQQTGLAS